jgi:hypothetical protein
MISSLPMPTFTVQDPMNIWRRIAMPPNIARDVFNVTVKTRFQWDTTRLKKKFDQATRVGLMRAGLDVRGSIRSGMSSRKLLAKPRLWKLTDTFTGATYMAAVTRPPKDDVVTSWKSKSFPEGFLKKSILSDWDFASKSVVAGPSKGQKAAGLQNMGGSATFHFVPWVKSLQRPNIKRHSKVYGSIVGYETDNAIFSFRRRLKPRSFIEKGTKKAIATKRMAKHFADQMNGP